MNLTCESTRWPIRHLLRLLETGALLPAGAAGGPGWTGQQQALLFASLQAGWPTGQLLAWNPDGADLRWHLLDGHRRALSVLALVAVGAGGLLRDLAADQPTDLPVYHAADGLYLPINARRFTAGFRAATRSLPPAIQRHADQHAHQVLSAAFDVVALRGGTPAQVAAVCARLVPGRVDPAVVHTIATAAGVWPLLWPPSGAPEQ